jgi:hypothetical protein
MPNEGHIDGALLFDGSEDYVEMDEYEGVPGTADRAVSAWIKTSESGGSLGKTIISWGDIATIGKKWGVVVHNSASTGTLGAVRVAVHGGYAIGSTVVNDGAWHHVVVVLDSDGLPIAADIKIYVDGVEDTISGILEPSGGIDTGNVHKVSIASMGGDGLHLFDGFIDDVRIYDRSLD